MWSNAVEMCVELHTEHSKQEENSSSIKQLLFCHRTHF